MSTNRAELRADQPLVARWSAALFGVLVGGSLSWWIGHDTTSIASYFNILSIIYLFPFVAVPSVIGFVLVLFRPRLGPLVRWFLLSAAAAGATGLLIFQYQQPSWSARFKCISMLRSRSTGAEPHSAQLPATTRTVPSAKFRRMGSRPWTASQCGCS